MTCHRLVGGAGTALNASAQQQLNHIAALCMTGYQQGRLPTLHFVLAERSETSS